jgi:hypothetical protein
MWQITTSKVPDEDPDRGWNMIVNKMWKSLVPYAPRYWYMCIWGVYTKHGFCVGQQEFCVGRQKLKLFNFCVVRPNFDVPFRYQNSAIFDWPDCRDVQAGSCARAEPPATGLSDSSSASSPPTATCARPLQRPTWHYKMRHFLEAHVVDLFTF